MITRLKKYLDEAQRTNFELKKAAFNQRAAIELSRFNVGYIPWTESALAPSALTQVLNDIIINKRSQILELGAGVSTIYVGMVLKTSGGHLHTFEHSEAWAQIVEDLVRTYGLSDFVSVHYAPLEEVTLGEIVYDWYRTEELTEVAKETSVDLLLVDGPPAYQKGNELARYPALPILKPYLSDSCSVFLDDIERWGEREIITRWRNDSDIKFTLNTLRGGIARGRRGPSLNTT